MAQKTAKLFGLRSKLGNLKNGYLLFNRDKVPLNNSQKRWIIFGASQSEVSIPFEHPLTSVIMLYKCEKQPLLNFKVLRCSVARLESLFCEQIRTLTSGVDTRKSEK